MRLSELTLKIDNLVLSKEDVSNYKNYIENKIKNVNGASDTTLVEDPFLDKIYNVASGFSSNLDLSYLKELLSNELEKKYDDFDRSVLNMCQTFFSLILKISQIDEDLVDKLYELYDVSFAGKFAFYLIEGKFNKDDVNDYLIGNLNEFKSSFIKRSFIKDCIILPYFFRDHYYYILHYNESRNNSFMEGFFMLNSQIITKKSCIFFLWENEKTGQVFLAIKQIGKVNIDKSIIKVFNGLLDLNISFYKYPIGNLGAIDRKDGIKNPTNWKINIRKSDLYSLGYESIISFSGENVMKDMLKLKEKTRLNLISTNIQYECINETTKKEIGANLTGTLTKYLIDYEVNNQKIGYFLSLLDSSGLIQNNNTEKINTKYKIITDCLLKGESFVVGESDEIGEIQEYISGAMDISNGSSRVINLGDVDFKSFTFINQQSGNSSIVGNLKIGLNLEKLFQKNIDGCIKFERCNNGKVAKFSFSGTRTKYLKGVILLFAHNIEDVLSILEKKNKYLIFLENEKVEGELIKQQISKSIILKIYGIKASEELLSRGKIFIKENISGYSNQDDYSLNIKQISESSNGDEFEDAISLILEPFLSRYIPLGKGIRGISLPDGMILDGGINIFYDAKSTKDIFSYLGSDEIRKFKSYIDIFPDNQDNLFVCFGPTTSDEILGKIEERVEMKELLHGGKKIIYVGADCLEFLYKIISSNLFKNAGKFLESNRLVKLFTESCEIGQFSQLKKERLKSDFIKYGFTSEYDKVLQKIDKRTESKVDYRGEIEKLKTYASNL